MRAFFLVNTISGGGAEKMVNNLARGFSEIGIPTYLIVLQSEKDLPEMVDGLHIRILFKGPSLVGVSKFFKLSFLSKRLTEVLEVCKYHPQKDLFTSHLPFSNYVAWLASVQDHFAVIHSTYSKLYSNRWLYPLISWIHSGKQLVFVSKGIESDFIENFGTNGSKTYQIYNPFDFDQIRKASEFEVDIIEGRYIIHLGRFSPEKRHDVLLEAFAGLKDREIKLLIVGDGDLRPEILDQIKSLGIEERVKLTGWIENPFPFLKNAQVLVLSSDFEGLPSVLIESLVLSTPVVSTDCLSGPSEILIGELSEFLSPVGDSYKLGQNIDQALKEYPLISESLIGKFSHSCVVKEYIKLKKEKN